ncbi:MAG: GNAT family N-acetyltransferase [Promethearchaeota archaeon]
MNFIIREKETDEDMEIFITQEIISARENEYTTAKSDEEMQEELLQFINSFAKTGIFLAETDTKEFTGFLWVSIRKGGELWDFEDSPAWIYDIKVLPEFRRQGLGRKFLLKAEEWAKKEGLPKIALHVFGHNKPAINLYDSFGYIMKSCYFQKELTSKNTVPSPNTNFKIRPGKNQQDKTNFLSLGFENFKAMALTGKKVPEEQIQEKYQKCWDLGDLDKPDRYVFIAETEKGDFAGFVWFYISQGDLGAKKYIWTLDLEVAPAFRGQGLGKQLLAYMEKWTLDQDLDTIRIGGVHSRNKIALHLFKSVGYKESNIFMEKDVS